MSINLVCDRTIDKQIRLLLDILLILMLAKNLNVLKGLVNGARGIIKGFDEGSAGLLIIH